MIGLYVIDYQEGFMNDDAYDAESVILDTIRLFRANNLPVMFSVFNSEENSTINRFLKWSNTSEEASHLHISPEPTEAIFHKDTYSAATDELLTYLKDRDIDKVVLVGCGTESSILATAYSLFDNGIQPIILETATFSMKSWVIADYALEIMENSFGRNNVLCFDGIRRLVQEQ